MNRCTTALAVIPMGSMASGSNGGGNTFTPTDDAVTDAVTGGSDTGGGASAQPPADQSATTSLWESHPSPPGSRSVTLIWIRRRAGCVVARAATTPSPVMSPLRWTCTRLDA